MGKDRVSRSSQRKALWEELNIWLQREKDMEVAFDLCAEERAKKTEFIRQEQAKLRKAIRALERGVHRQRAWNRGDLLY
jgi:hypothetical protein